MVCSGQPVYAFTGARIPGPRRLGKELPEDQIIWNCANEYQLSVARARRFVKEITCQLQKLISNTREEKVTLDSEETCLLLNEQVFSAKYYLINGKTFGIRYGNPELEHMIHPGFGYLENKPDETKPIIALTFSKPEINFFCRLTKKPAGNIPIPNRNSLSGRFLLNCLIASTRLTMNSGWGQCTPQRFQRAKGRYFLPHHPEVGKAPLPPC